MALTFDNLALNNIHPLTSVWYVKIALLALNNIHSLTSVWQVKIALLALNNIHSLDNFSISHSTFCKITLD